MQYIGWWSWIMERRTSLNCCLRLDRMTSGARLPTCKERENNKRRERRRRALAAKIFAGLRLYGNYKLPKHCDNNEVLKALCTEAGWTVEDEGSTYRKGSKPAATGHQRMELCTSSAASEASPTSSYTNDGTSLIPWLKGLSSSGGNGSASTSSSAGLPPLHGGSSSAPVTPPLSSPTGLGAPVTPDWDVLGKDHHSFLAAAAVAAHVAASNQCHLRPGYCDTPDGARTPVEDDASDASPCLGLEFAAVCGANSSKWANGVRVRTGPGRVLLAPFGGSGGKDELTFSHPRRNPMQKSISTPVSPVSSRMKGSFGERLGHLEFSGAVQGLGSLWELDAGAEEAAVPVKRKLPADDLELTLGNSSLRTL